MNSVYENSLLSTPELCYVNAIVQVYVEKWDFTLKVKRQNFQINFDMKFNFQPVFYLQWNSLFTK